MNHSPRPSPLIRRLNKEWHAALMRWKGQQRALRRLEVKEQSAWRKLCLAIDKENGRKACGPIPPPAAGGSDFEARR